MSKTQSAFEQYIERTPNGTEIPDGTFTSRHRGVIAFTAAFLPFLFVISRMEGLESITGAELPAIPLLHSIGGVGLALAILGVAALPQIPRRSRSSLAAVGFMVNASILAYFTGGFIEAHFLYFVGVGVVALYEDWVPFAITITYVALQHSVFGLMEWFTVYNHQAAMANPVVWGGIHGVGVLMLATAVTFLWQSLAIQREQAREKIQEKLNEAEKAQEEAEKARELAEEKQRTAAEQKERMTELNEELEATATEFQSVMVECADGDFTRRLDTSVDNEAMAEIAVTFNEMMGELEQTVGTIRAFANDVATASEEVTIGANESRSASQQVSESIQAISADAESQSGNIQEIAGEMQSLSGAVEEIASSADEIATSAQSTADLGESGQEAAADAMEEMERIKEKSEKTNEEVQALATEIDEISEIVELIRDIAEQTNMLALNASIEAARAGEAGEGFAVVADEIKGLAGDVSEATEEVESLISEIQSSADTAVVDIQEMGDRVSSGTATIEDALGALEAIAATIEESNEGIQEISAATDDQAASTEEVASMIDEVADAAEQVSGEAGNVSAAAQQQASSLTQVSQNTRNLSAQADDLRELLSQFTIQEATAEKVDADKTSQGGVGTDSPARDQPVRSTTDGSGLTTAPDRRDGSSSGKESPNKLDTEDL